MIEQLKALLRTAQEELTARKASLDEAHQRVMDAKPDDENIDVAALRTAFDEAGEAFDEAAAEVERCDKNLKDAERRERVAAANKLEPATRQPISVGDEPAVYGPGSENSFFTDAYRFQFGFDSVARERLERHGKQNVVAMKRSADLEGQRRREAAARSGIELPVEPYMFRDVGTGAFAGLTVPQYLIDQFAPLARAGAPTLNMIARKLPLPASGMTLNISRLTTGTAVAAQATENSGVQETDSDDTLLSVNVRTYAGQQDVSRQALERSEMVDEVVFQDLIAAYFAKLDASILNDDGTSGTHLGVRSTSGIIAVTYTDASPTLPELYPKLSDGIQQINGNVFAPATAIVMAPRRWGWGTAALDSTSRPLFESEAGVSYNPIAVGEAAAYGQVVGRTAHGLPVITDGNIVTNNGAGTNEDQIFIVSGWNMLFWQEGDGMPRQFRFEQANAPQSVRLAVWGYSAFSAGRYPGGSAVISGTGLVTPTF